MIDFLIAYCKSGNKRARSMQNMNTPFHPASLHAIETKKSKNTLLLQYDATRKCQKKKHTTQKQNEE